MRAPNPEIRSTFPEGCLDQATRRWYEQLFRDSDAFEVRHLRGREEKTKSYLIETLLELEDLFRRICNLEEGDWYCTVNRPANVKGLRSVPFTDDSMSRHTRLLFDFDPVRSKGHNSTDEEVKEALEQARLFALCMYHVNNWPMPAVGISGNGAHVVYRCNITADELSRDVLADFYRFMKEEWSTESVKFDPTVRNPSRIWRMYGTVNRKSPHREGRPQRLATIDVPSRWGAISAQTIRNYVAAKRKTARRPDPTVPRQYVREDQKNVQLSSLDIVSWFAAHGALRDPIGGNRHGVVCPWSDEHTSASPRNHSDSVIFDNGPGTIPWFHCSHAHCDGRGLIHVVNRWGDAGDYCRASATPVPTRFNRQGQGRVANAQARHP